MTEGKSGAAGDRLAALQELELTQGEPFEDLDRLVLLAADICHANLAAFTVHDETTAYEVSSSFGVRGTMPKSECMCSLPLGADQMLHVPDAAADPRLARARYVAGPPHVRSFVGVPIGVDANIPIGILAVGHTDPGKFTETDINRLAKVSELVSAFLIQRRAGIRAMRAAETTEAERKRQHLYELSFNAIQEGVNIHTPSGEVVEMNPACLRILGLTRDEMQGRAYTDPRWRTFRPDGSPFPSDEYPVAITLRTGESVANVPMGIDLPSGERRWISINTVPLRNEQTGAVDYAVVSMKDISAQYEAERHITAQNMRLAEALDAAEKANRAKTDFMGVMSHELRTPMNAIIGCARLMSETKLDPIQKRTLGVLEDASKQMLAVLNDLLDLSALNADKVRIEAEPVSLLRLLEDAAVIWAGDLRGNTVSLSVMVDPELAEPRLVDSARVLQIVGNLMANAVKFTTEGSVSLRAWPERSVGRPDGVVIEVEDTGPGVSSEAEERIFLPFEQIDVSAKRRRGGLGLGLPIARRLAQAMGGDITLDTKPGHGSCFVVVIQAPKAPDFTAGSTANDRRNKEQPSRDILCVDDNPRNLYVLGGVLRAAGHQTTECTDGREAIALLRNRKFDLVLLDMVMPDMDGFDVLSQLREEGGLNANTPVIACTANVLPDQIAAYREAGTADVIAKPIDPRAMLLAVANAG